VSFAGFQEAGLGAALRRPSRAVAGWCAIYCFVIAIAALVLLGRGAALGLVFPTLGFLLGVFLFATSPAQYIGYSWWLWFLAPEVRRFVDFHSAWHPISPVMLTPLLVAGLSAVTLVRRSPALRLRELAGFALVVVALFYGFVVGFAKTGPFAASFAILNWAVPVAFAFHIAASAAEYPSHRSALRRSFTLGTLVMGVYGVFQYFVLPPWDQFWLVNVDMPSQGYPYPTLFRVFSTMHSCGPFAFIIGAGLLLLMTGGGVLRLPAAAAGVASFALSLVRAAWLGWVVGVIVLLAKLRLAMRLQLVLAAVLVAAIGGPILLNSPLSGPVGERIGSLTALDQDESYADRRQFYKDFLGVALSDIAGEGIGSTGTATKLSNNGEMGEYGYFDSGVMQLPFVLGWFGCAVYVAGLLALLRQGVFAAPPKGDDFAAAAQAIAVSIGVMLISDNTLVGVMGMGFWTFLGAGLAARRHAALWR